MASVALLFQHRFSKVLIAATNSYAELTPWGTHQLLDPLWSTELMEFEHDGGEATRFEKTVHISEHDLALRWLRVCFKNPDGAYNCGRCVKCLRTMIALRTVGALERCKTLPQELSLEEVAKIELSNDSSRFVLRQTVETLQHLGTEPDLAQTLAMVLEEDARTQEIRAAQSQRLEQQLSVTRNRLERTRARLEAARTRNRRLAKRNRRLTGDYSGRRYRVVDALVRIASRLPGIGPLVKQKGAAGDQ